MIFASLLTVALASLAPLSAAQDDTQGPIVYDAEHNATAIWGTWSSGSQSVQTGPGFCDPTKLTFDYPRNTGVSYSFSQVGYDHGYYEIARYRFNANGSDPTCITGVIAWVHGTVTLNANGSLWMRPFGDGFQQIQDPCAAVSNFIETYNETEYYKGWRIFEDPTAGPKLHLFQHDGAPVAPMFLSSRTPTMFPTQLLRNNTFVVVQRRGLEGEEEQEEEAKQGKNGAGSVVMGQVAGAIGAATAVVLAAASMLV